MVIGNNQKIISYHLTTAVDLQLAVKGNIKFKGIFSFTLTIIEFC